MLHITPNTVKVEIFARFKLSLISLGVLPRESLTLAKIYISIDLYSEDSNFVKVLTNKKVQSPKFVKISTRESFHFYSILSVNVTIMSGYFEKISKIET